MPYTGFLGGIGTSFSNGDLISPVRSVDECDLGSGEETGEKLVAVGSGKVSFDQFDIFEAEELLGH